MSTKFTILGCGSSIGVPRIDGFFGKCDPKNPKNHRSRCSAAITTKNLNILILNVEFAQPCGLRLDLIIIFFLKRIETMIA